MPERVDLERFKMDYECFCESIRNLQEEERLAKKSSWPELIGTNGETAVEQIKKERPTFEVLVSIPGAMYTNDRVETRVRVQVNKFGDVWKEPRTG